VVLLKNPNSLKALLTIILMLNLKSELKKIPKSLMEAVVKVHGNCFQYGIIFL
jgi:hypothetical protein